MKKSLLSAGVLSVLLLAACGGQAEKPSEKPAEQAAAAAPAGSAKADVEAREQLMKAFKEDFGVMGKMVKGETAYDAAAFKAAAEKLNANADKPWAHYTEASAQEESEAKPEVWSKAAEFQQEAEKFVAAVAALNTAAATAENVDAVKAAFGQVGQSCKACHDSFRKD
ncbi:c-type cytochrome [Bergeriella denitrificans]|uniref:C-type cytochrome n=1 Tax=Bergeriella denitrificans TaxID=494 RepID=A0A378UIF3_BERDE|nr:cytochrome c [Bergeriella denitrificans]STZ77117.1 C-type cytochrome [Bergeriella denitrificans]